MAEKPAIALERLASQLQVDVEELPALKSLPSAQQKTLVEQVDAAREKQREELQTAIQNALGHLPALLRRPVMKILRG